MADHDTWLRERGRGTRTRTEYRRQLEHVNDWLMASYGADLLTATPAQIREWRSSLTVQDNTVLGYVTSLRSFYRWALWARLVTTDPSAHLPLPRRRKGRPRPIPENLLVTALVNAPPMVRPWLMLAALLGLRACEIAVMRREDIIEYGDTRVLVVHGKGGKDRIVPLRDQAWQELVLSGLPVKGYLFKRGDRRPGPRRAQNISQHANTYLHSIGITETLHQLRHRFGTRTYAECRDIRVVQELMGHAGPATTALYADYSQAAAVNVVGAIEIDLSQPDGRKLAADPPRREIDRTPHRPIRPGVLQGETPRPLRVSELPETALELAVQNRATDDHPVREARRVATRVSIVERKKSVLTMKIPHGSIQFPLSHVARASQVSRPTMPSTRSP